MQRFSPQIRHSTTISLTFLQGSEPHRIGQISESSLQRGWLCVYLALVFIQQSMESLQNHGWNSYATNSPHGFTHAKNEIAASTKLFVNTERAI